MMETIPQYESKYGVTLIDRLGDGKDGNVFKASRERAVKFLNSDELLDLSLNNVRFAIP